MVSLRTCCGPAGFWTQHHWVVSILIRFNHSNINMICCLFIKYFLVLKGSSDRTHPNQVRITVTFPHRDGMLPVVSTYRPSNFDFILSPNALRVAQHQCSNLLDISEVQSSRGFISNRTRNVNSFGEMESYQYSTRLRSERTLRFYR